MEHVNMGDNAMPPAPGRSGCLKWTCGCFALAALICAAGAAAGAWFLSGWSPGKSAWERLPGGTVFAVEAHDVATLLQTLSNDPGAASLAHSALRRFQSLLEKRGIPAREDFPDAVLEWGGNFGWIHTMLLPNYVLYGIGDFAGGGAFFIIQPPRWFAWTAGLSLEEGAVREIADDRGTRISIAFRDGFVVASLNGNLVARIVNNWANADAPLGKAADRSGPYVMLAGRMEAGERGGAGRSAGAEQEGGPFLSGGLADTFARREPIAPPGEENPPDTAASPSGTRRLQALAFPDESGWNIRFEAANMDKPAAAASFDKHIEETMGGDKLEVALPDASDLEIALRPQRSLLERIRAIPLLYGVLNGVGERFSLLASRPAAKGDAPYPPLPVLSLGWDLSPARAPEESAVHFAASLEDALDAIRAGGGPIPPNIAHFLVSGETANDNLSGTLSLPEVLVNGARPAWKFLPRATPPMGWFATDPSGLPEEKLVPRLAAQTLPEPVDGSSTVTANWDMSRAFIDAVAAVAEDRLSQLPREWFAELPGGKDGVAPALRAARSLFTAYPRGTLRAAIHPETREATGKAFIPFGIGGDF